MKQVDDGHFQNVNDTEGSLCTGHIMNAFTWGLCCVGKNVQYFYQKSKVEVPYNFKNKGKKLVLLRRDGGKFSC